MIGTLLNVLASSFVFAFVLCCIVSGILQVLAWTRHTRAGAPVTLRALWRPAEYFDEVGLRQITLARRLLTVGGIAYLSYGAMVLAATVLQ